MDAFWTDAQISFRRKARDYFRRESDSLPPQGPVMPARIWQELLSAPGPDAAPGRRGLSEEVLVIDEASSRRPSLGLDLLRWRISRAPIGPTGERLFLIARLAGTAAHVFEAGVRAARDKGFFASSLMDFREIQESLAGLASGVEILRLGACRVCHLLGHGEQDRGEAESNLLYEKALALSRDARSVALRLLGEAWIMANLPGDESPSENERNRS